MSTRKDAIEQRSRVNSAQRLHAVLIKLRNSAAPTLSQALPQSFGLSPWPSPIGFSEDRIFIEALVLLHRMFDDLINEIAETGLSEDDQKFYTECLPGICAAIPASRGYIAWVEGRRAITDVDLTRIQGVDRMLRIYIPEVNLADDELKGFSEAIDKAVAAIVDSEIPTSLKRLILGKLTDVKHAVTEYSARGAQGLMESLSGYVGVLKTTGDAFKDNLKEDQRLRLTEVVAIGNSLLTLAKGAVWAWPHVHELAATVTSVILSAVSD